MKRNKYIYLSFWPAVFFLIITAAVFYQNIAKFIGISKLTAANYESLRKLDKLLIQILEAESAQRGYVLTGEDFFLGSYQDLFRSIRAETKELRGLFADTLDKKNELIMLEGLTAKKLALLEERINLRKEEGFEPAMQSIKSGEGRRITVEIEKIISGISSREAGLLIAASQKLRANIHNILSLIYFLSFLSIVVIFIVFKDIKRAETTVREAAFYTRSLIEAGLDPLVTISAEGKITDVNKATEEVTGVAREKLIGADFSDYFTEPKKARAGYKEVFEKGFVVDYPLAIRHVSGRVTDVLYNAKVYQDEQGNVQGVFAAARDVTERKKVEGELRKSQEKLRVLNLELEERISERIKELVRSNAELEQFVHIASHDLREPLRMVSNYLQLIEERYRGKLDSEADEFINFAVDGAKRMQVLIGDLVEYSSVDKMAKPFLPVDVTLVLSWVLNNLKVSIDDAGIKITSSSLPEIMADQMQIMQLFQNLISNAIKFRDRQRQPEVQISAQKQGSDWVFQIRDNGIGFEQQYAERIFLIFQRLHTREEYPGTGVGLSIAKKIVERHGGRIWAESEPGKGAVFYFTIPVRAIPKED